MAKQRLAKGEGDLMLTKPKTKAYGGTVEVAGIELPRCPTEVQADFVVISPAMAKELLSRNATNRSVSKNRVTILANAIRRGEWDLNGESVKISAQGLLIDGQHRLTAICWSGISVPSLIVWGVDYGVQSTVDYTRARSVKDALSLMGVPQASAVAAALTVLKKLLDGNFNRIKNTTITPKQGMDLWSRNTGILESVRKARNAKNRGAISPTAGTLAGAHYYLYGIDREDADYFLEKLAIPSELPEDHPISQLNRRFVQDRLKPVSMSQYLQLAILFKAWNLFRSGERVSVLAFRPGGKSPERVAQPV